MSASDPLAACAAFGLMLIARSEKDRTGAISLLGKAAAGYRETYDYFGEAHTLLALAELLGDGGDGDEARSAQETAQPGSIGRRSCTARGWYGTWLCPCAMGGEFHDRLDRS